MGKTGQKRAKKGKTLNIFGRKFRIFGTAVSEEAVFWGKMVKNDQISQFWDRMRGKREILGQNGARLGASKNCKCGEGGGKGVENGEKGQNGPIFGGEEERGIVGFWGKKQPKKAKKISQFWGVGKMGKIDFFLVILVKRGKITPNFGSMVAKEEGEIVVRGGQKLTKKGQSCPKMRMVFVMGWSTVISTTTVSTTTHSDTTLTKILCFYPKVCGFTT